jgi:sugar phosphate isomerase/epimerase
MRLTVQLYTLRNELSNDLEGTLDRLQSIGLGFVELAGDYGRSASEWKQLLDARGLKVSASHVGLAELESNLGKVIEDNQTLENPFVVLPWLSPDDYASGWTAMAQRVEPIGRKLQDAGFRFAYHNHAFEFENDGLSEFYEAADPKFVEAQLDLAWVKLGGDDPLAWIEKLTGRLPLVHLKDFDPSKTPQWTPAGQGTLDFDTILPACAKAQVVFGAIELDESPIAPLDAVQQSVEYFNSKGIR